MPIFEERKELCQTSNLDKPCNNYPNISVISQYHQDIEYESRGLQDTGNLIPIIEALTAPKKELFEAICNCINGYEFDKMPTYMLDCYGSILGISREMCNAKKVESDEAYRKIIRARLQELSSSQITLKELQVTLDDMFGAGSTKICQDDKCIHIFMQRDLTPEERNNLQQILDSLPTPNNQCVKLYPQDIVKCFFWDNDLNEVTQGGWEDTANWDCTGKENEIYTKNNPTDKSQELDKCFYWDAPFINNTPYGFHTTDKNGRLMVGWEADGIWDCGKGGNDAVIGAVNFYFKAMAGNTQLLESKATDLAKVDKYEWRDENNNLLSTDKDFEYTYIAGSHLIQLKIFDDRNNVLDYKVFHLVGMEPPVINQEQIVFEDFAGATITISSDATDNISVTLYEWYKDGVLISNAKDLKYTILDADVDTKILLIVKDDDKLGAVKEFTVTVKVPCFFWDGDLLVPMHGKWDGGTWCA